jgi:hypothetical protein
MMIKGSKGAPNTRWSRQRLSALVVSRLFGFVGILTYLDFVQINGNVQSRQQGW